MTDSTKSVAPTTAKKTVKKVQKVTVADYISAQLEISGKAQVTVAREVGWTQNNMISMLKSGRIKLPLHRVKSLAQALNVDANNLMKMCIEEYYPEVSEVMEELRGQPILTKNELEFIKIMREEDPNDPRLYTESQEAGFRNFVHSLTTEEERARIANLHAQNERIAREKLLKEKEKIEARLNQSNED